MRVDIQVLRGIAVLLVLGFHAEINGFKSGFLGVDIFFVISGFVIFASIQRQIDRSQTFSVSNFLSRRIRRLLPTATLGVAVAIFLAVISQDPFNGMKETLSSGFASMVYGNNFLQISRNPYFEASSSTLIHYWSLAVEEQFYLLLVGVFALLKIFKGTKSKPLIRHAVLVIAGFSALSVLCSEILRSPTWRVHVMKVFNISDTKAQMINFYSPLTRFWEIGVGCLFAFVAAKWTNPSSKALNFSSLTGVILIAVSMLRINSNTPFPGFNAAPLIVGTGLLILGGSATSSWINKLLARQNVLRWMGDRSYGIYVFHLPLLVFSKYDFDNETVATVVGLTSAVVVAAINYFLLENPLRLDETIVGGRAARLFAINAVILIMLVGIGFGGRMLTQLRFNDIREATSLDQRPVSVLGRCDGERIPNHPAWCWFKNNESDEYIVLMGDSHAISLSAGVLAAAKDIDINLLVIGEVACQINETVDDLTCQEQNRIRMEYVLENKPRAVFLADRYFDSQPWAEGLAPVVNRLTTNGIPTIVFGPIPTVSFDPSISWIKPSMHKEFLPLEKQYELSNSLNDLRSILKNQNNYTTIDLGAIFCPNRLCTAFNQQQLQYFDDNHLNSYGSSRLKDSIAATYRTLIKNS
jgi:peptidoglycan/LPS O-acetylase OafA/YrhL